MKERQTLVLGIDAGTHGIRILAVDAGDGSVIRNVTSGYERHIGKGIQELRAEDAVKALYEAFGKLALPEGARVSALGITHQRGTVVPVDADLSPVFPALCDSDERAAGPEGYRAAGIDPDRYYRESGCPVVSFNGFSKILWMKENCPEVFGRTAAWLSLQDYLLSVLCGRIRNTEGSLLRSGLLDIRTREPHAGHLGAAGISAERYIRLGESAGTPSEETAGRFPFLAGAGLIAVPGDQPAAYIGSLAAKRDCPAMNLGTTFVMSMPSGRAMLAEDGLVTSEVLPGGRWAPEFGTGAGGQFMDFLVRLLGKEREGSAFWEKMNAAAAGIPAGSEGLRVTPLLWQVTSGGVEGCIRGLLPHHTDAHLIRASYEGLAFEAALSAKKLAAAAGGDAAGLSAGKPLVVFGGLSASGCFLQILSSVLGIPVEAAGQLQSSAYGAACAAGEALSGEEAPGLKEPCGEAPVRRFEPDEEDRRLYGQIFEEYGKKR